jgi:hypothetical protein
MGRVSSAGWGEILDTPAKKLVAVLSDQATNLLGLAGKIK